MIAVLGTIWKAQMALKIKLELCSHPYPRRMRMQRLIQPINTLKTTRQARKSHCRHKCRYRAQEPKNKRMQQTCQLRRHKRSQKNRVVTLKSSYRSLKVSMVQLLCRIINRNKTRELSQQRKRQKMIDLKRMARTISLRSLKFLSYSNTTISKCESLQPRLQP